MSICSKKGIFSRYLALSVAASSLVMAAPVWADAPPVEDRIAALEAMVKALQDELKAQKATSAESLLKVEKKVDEANAAIPANTEGFLVGDTRIKLGGFVDLDVHVTDFADGDVASNSIGRDFYIPGLTPVGGVGEDPSTDFTAEATRFQVSASRKVGDVASTALLEIDFLGSGQGDERVTNSFAPRLRRAYLSHGAFLAGQEWSTFQNLTTIPESASFLAAQDGIVFVRQAQIRYTSGDWQFALENGTTTIGLPNGTRLEADDNFAPDLVVRRNFKGVFGDISVSGLLRQLKGESTGFKGDTVSLAGSVAGSVKISDSDKALFSLSYGEGLGRYITLNAINDAVQVGNEIEGVPMLSVMAGWRKQINPTTRFSGAVSFSEADYEGDWNVPGSTTEFVGSVFGALLWDIAPKVTTGVEVMLAKRETVNGLEGNMARFTYSMKYLY